MEIDVRGWRQTSMCCLLSKVREHWLRPFPLCGEVTWSWISNVSCTFRFNLRSSAFNVFTFSQSNPAVYVWAWMARNTSQDPLLITDRLFVLFHSHGNFQRCNFNVLFSTPSYETSKYLVKIIQPTSQHQWDTVKKFPKICWTFQKLADRYRWISSVIYFIVHIIWRGDFN